MSIFFCEDQPDVASAKRRERQVKHWTRAKKEALIARDTEMLKALAGVVRREHLAGFQRKEAAG